MLLQLMMSKCDRREGGHEELPCSPEEQPSASVSERVASSEAEGLRTDQPKPRLNPHAASWTPISNHTVAAVKTFVASKYDSQDDSRPHSIAIGLDPMLNTKTFSEEQDLFSDQDLLSVSVSQITEDLSRR